MNAPLVTIVTVNYNGTTVTERLLESLANVIYPEMEIIVVDNASSASPDSLKEKFPYITLIKNTINKGFAAANNDGFRIAKGELFLMLNNDTEVDPNFLWPMVQTIVSSKMVGAVCPKIKYFEKPEIVQFAGYDPISKYTGRGAPIGDKEPDKKQYDRIYPIPYGHGAAFMLKREVYDKVGPMSEDYFLYYEEIDYCERIRNAGFNILFNGHSIVYHKESMSVGINSPLKVFYNTRNRILFLRRYSSYMQQLAFIAYHTVVVLPVHSIRYLRKGQFGQFNAMIKGIRWNFTHSATGSKEF